MKTTFLPWIEKQKDKIDWDYLSDNINAIPQVQYFYFLLYLDGEKKNSSSNNLFELFE